MVAAMEPTTIQSSILKAGVLTDEAIRNGSLKKNTNNRGNGKEPSRDRNVKDDNKRSRIGRTFATTTNPVRKEYMANERPRMVNLLNAKNLTAAHGVCFECGGTDHYKSACPRLNRAPGQGGYHPNKAMAIEGGQGYGKNGNPTRGRAFVMGAEEDR
ncbi:putative reverse transcriptase domain-containing protein [Tanacetum coccineum]